MTDYQLTISGPATVDGQRADAETVSVDEIEEIVSDGPVAITIQPAAEATVSKTHDRRAGRTASQDSTDNRPTLDVDYPGPDEYDLPDQDADARPYEWSRDRVLDCLAVWLEHTHSDSWTAYKRDADDIDGLPSIPTIKRHVGQWSDARDQAYDRLDD